MHEFPELLPHGDIISVLDDVFIVMGSNVIVHDGLRMQASRTMTIIRENGELTLVNTIRLNDDGLQKLATLGRIKNIVRLGAFHGRDDAFYQKTFGATLWASARMELSHGESIDREIATGEAPISDATFINFTSTKFSEALLFLSRAGGLLISCDSIKNWTQKDAFFDDKTFAMMQASGAIGPAKIDTTWLSAMNPSKEELESITQRSFKTLITAHGMPLQENAKASVVSSVREAVEFIGRIGKFNS